MFNIGSAITASRKAVSQVWKFKFGHFIFNVLNFAIIVPEIAMRIGNCQNNSHIPGGGGGGGRTLYALIAY